MRIDIFDQKYSSMIERKSAKKKQNYDILIYALAFIRTVDMYLRTWITHQLDR